MAMPIDNPITRRGVMAGAAATALLATSRAMAKRTSPNDELTRLSIEEASRRIAARDLSPVDLTRAYLARIEDIDPRVNSFITVMADQALAQSRALEAELVRSGPRSPLHGIPIGLKDNIDTAGVLTTAASAVYADRIPTADAECVRKLRAAGAVFLGKLNMHEFAYGGTCAVSHYGPVRNPWNLQYTPGGSSGGSAAAVAARLCAAALGTDTAASIRLPAAYCGVTGFKATHGLASIRGIVPLSEMHDHVGPIARSVADCALVMTELAGFDSLDPVSIRAGRELLADALGADISQLRIGIPRVPFFENLDPEIAAATEVAITTLKGMTRGLTEVALPFVDSFAVLNAEIYEYHAPLVADPARRARYGPLTIDRILGGANVPSTELVKALRRMAIARNTVGELFSRVDVLVAPTAMRMSVTVEAARVDRSDSRDLDLIHNTLPFNVYGIPAISVPCGFTRAGLPIGLQIIGPRLGEGRVLALAGAYQQATPWHRRNPPIA
jgi:aspartyl-tRNA(Asn)/glutamyl-tRNA(Gln) amidotransferase subunit A